MGNSGTEKNPITVINCNFTLRESISPSPREKDKILVEAISLLIFGIILAMSIERFFSPGGLSNSKWGYIVCAGLFFILIGISLIGFLIAYWKWIPFFLQVNRSKIKKYIPYFILLIALIILLIILYYSFMEFYTVFIIIIKVLFILFFYILSINVFTLFILFVLSILVVITYILFFFKNININEGLSSDNRKIPSGGRRVNLFFTIMFIFFISLFPLFIEHTIKACGCVENNSNEKYNVTLVNIDNIQKVLVRNSQTSLQKCTMEDKNLTIETLVSQKPGTFDFEIVHILFFPFWFFFVILGIFLPSNQ